MQKPFIRTLRVLSIALSVTLAACGGGEPAPATPSTSSAPSVSSAPAAASAAPAEPSFAAAMVSPLTKEVPLQIVSIFPLEAGETLISPATELAAFVAKQRAEGGFGKDPLRTLLLDPAPAPTKAQRLLYVALGPRADFSIGRVKEIGATAMRETIRMSVDRMAFAPIVRDQGVTTIGADDVAAAFVEGALVEYDSERRAAPATKPALREVIYEAGPPFIDAVTKAVARGVEAAHARTHGAAPAP